MATRPMGDAALLMVERILPTYDLIELDFSGHVPTPSFADQFVGGLAGRIGLEEFRRRVKISNAPDAAHSLLRHVILKKAMGPMAVSQIKRPPEH